LAAEDEGIDVGSKKREQRKAKEAARRVRPPQAVAGEPLGISGRRQMPSARQIIERLVTEGVYAREAGKAAAVTRVSQALTEQPTAAKVLLALLQSEVVSAWRRGWQPAELVRSAHREFTGDHSSLLRDVIAAQMQAYAAATIDERWQAQLAQLRAEVSWQPEDDLLALHGGTSDQIATHVAERVITIIWHLRRLPPMPFVGPLPGEARQGSLKPSAAQADQRMLDRVRALLAKAESTTFPEEAEAYTAKAQELMARYSIDYALLVARTGARDEPAVRRIPIDNPYEGPKTLLLQAVAEANRCRSVWSKYFGFSTVMGYPTDLDSVELLFTSLLVQAIREMTQVRPKQDRYGRNNIRSFRQSFLTSYAQRVGERLSTATGAAVEEAEREATGMAGASDLLPVLKARADRVEEKFRDLFPDVRAQTVSVSNQEGWAHGRAAADRADLHGRGAIKD
jgi:hypothetical protein